VSALELPFDMEERVEDAFVAYIQSAVSQTTNMKVYAAYTTDAIQYPCVTVNAMEADNITPDADWNVSKLLDVKIAVMTEAKAEVDGLAKVINTPRQLNANARAAVLKALSIASTDTGPSDIASIVQAQPEDMPKGLAAYLVYQKIPGVWIKLARLGRRVRDFEVEKNCLVTEISVAVIAQPVQIGGY
jgi:hypothetical protein